MVYNILWKFLSKTYWASILYIGYKKERKKQKNFALNFF